MDVVAFNEVVDIQLSTVSNMLVNKRRQYADDVDVLHNFRSAAQLHSSTLVSALAGMMAKHTVSIYDMAREANPDDRFSLQLWDEKITDHIAYLVLLKAVLVEEHTKRQQKEKAYVTIAEDHSPIRTTGR